MAVTQQKDFMQHTVQVCRENSSNVKILKVLLNSSTSLPFWNVFKISNILPNLIWIYSLFSWNSALFFLYTTENRTPHLLTVNSTNPIALHYKNSNNRSLPWIWRLSNADPTGFLTLHVEATNVDKECVINIHDGSSSQDKQIARISSRNTSASYFSTSKDLWISANLKNGTLSVIVTSGKVTRHPYVSMFKI